VRGASVSARTLRIDIKMIAAAETLVVSMVPTSANEVPCGTRSVLPMIMIRIGVALVLWLGPTQLYAQEPMDTPVTDHDLELAKKLTNPVAALISVPFQGNADYGMGDTEDGSQYQLKLEPVIPIAMTRDWNLISRTILPITYQQDVMPQNDQGGLGDTLESLFASPEKPGPAGLFWGIGPAASIPTATDDALGAGKLSIGPTAALLRQDGGWTIGILALFV
jgi:hypothetical protein